MLNKSEKQILFPDTMALTVKLLAFVIFCEFSVAFEKHYPFKDLTGCKEYNVKSGQNYQDVEYHSIERFKNNRRSLEEYANLKFYISGEDDLILILSTKSNKHWDFCKALQIFINQSF